MILKQDFQVLEWYTLQRIVKNTNRTLKFAFYASGLTGPHSDCYISRAKMIFKPFTFCLTFMLQHVTKLS